MRIKTEGSYESGLGPCLVQKLLTDNLLLICLLPLVPYCISVLLCFVRDLLTNDLLIHLRVKNRLLTH